MDYDGGNIRHVAHGTITPSHKLELVERLVVLHQDLLKIVEDFKPVTAAAEETFVNQNGASTLKLGLARGVLLLAPALSNIAITEYQGVDLRFRSANGKNLRRKSSKTISNGMNELINRALIKEALR